MIGDRRIVFAQPLQRSNLCASHRQRRWLTYLSYTQAIRSRVTVNWATVPTVTIDPGQIPPEVEMKAALPNNLGKMSLSGPGRLDEAGLAEFRATRRLQELVFELARTLTRDYVTQPRCLVPAHVLFPQLVPIIERYLRDNVKVKAPGDKKDVFLSPYFGWVSERLVEAIQPDTSQGEAPEVPRYETSRGPGSTAEVDTWTSRDVREVVKSHVNYVVADTKRWEQATAYYLDKNPSVQAFVKNAGLGFAIPYLHNGQMQDGTVLGDLREIVVAAVSAWEVVLETFGLSKDSGQS